MRDTSVLQERLGTGQVKGGMLKSHLRWVTDNHVPSEVNRFWDHVPQDIREQIGAAVLEIRWYDFATLIAIDRTILNVFARGQEFLARELGRYSARLNLTGTYKAYQRQSVQAFFEGCARVHSAFQDFGSAQYVRTGDKSCELHHRDYTSFSPLFCQSALGYYEEAILVHKGTGGRVVEKTCQCAGDQACTFAMSWS